MNEKKRGFTLIELLVVIAIIAVLMGILMPTLRKVKEQGNMIKCLGNLRQWNVTHSMYLQENNGKFYSGTSGDAFWWIAQMKEQDQSRIDNPLWFCPKTKGTYQEADGTMSGKLSIFTAWGIYTSGHSNLTRDGIAGSYGINGYTLSVTGATGAMSEGRNAQDFWKTPQVRGAAQIPLMAEALRFDLWPQHTNPPAANEEAVWSSDNHMARACMNRHVGYVNISFCDFSARKAGLKELYTFKWHKRFNISGPYTVAGGVTADRWPDWIRPYKDY
ncbi:MAG: type II secretion system protein [Sedimentisphaerales bacterium]|nr:type II secretion system protein [Sedimentisphaerales bacterium]